LIDFCRFVNACPSAAPAKDHVQESRDTTTGFIGYSTSTGKASAVLGVYELGGQAGGDISLYWVNSAGNILVVGVLTPGGIRVGVINGEKFTPLPGTTDLGAAAW
jgi:hypothetical protein